LLVTIDVPRHPRATLFPYTTLFRSLYQHYRAARRDLALLLLIDISGSTDGWVSQDLRVIDVEREALLLVSIALDGLGEPYAIHRSEEHTSELQSRENLVCRLLLEKK